VYRSIAKHKKHKKPHTFAKSWNILMPDMPLASVFDACSSTILHYDILKDNKKPGGLQKPPLDMQRCRNGVSFSNYNKNIKINDWQIHSNVKELKNFPFSFTTFWTGTAN